MNLHVIVIRYSGQEPWVSTAWDEYSIEENYKGFEESLEKAKKEAGDKGDVRVAIIKLSDSFMSDLFKPTVVKGQVVT